MAAFSTYLANNLLNAVLRNVAYTLPATVYAGLYTVAPTAAGGGTEVSGNSYARVAATFGAASAGSVTNSGTVTFPTSSGSWGTVVAVGLFDALTSGNLLFFGNLAASVSVGSGVAPKFSASTLTVSLT
jgi:hypothetical protein